MKLLQHGRNAPRAKTIRPVEPYLIAAAEKARRLGHNCVGTEHVLSPLLREQDGASHPAAGEDSCERRSGRQALACWLDHAAPAAKIDAQALAALEIDFDAVRERLEQTFGPGALERTSSGCITVCPRLKMAEPR